MTASAKDKLKAKLAKLPKAERKAYLVKLRERIDARKKAQPAVDQPSKPVLLVETPNDLDRMLNEIINGDTVATTEEERRRATRGLSLLEIWKGLRILASAHRDLLKYVRDMYNAGVSRKPDLPDDLPGSTEIRQIDPHKLYEFAHQIPGWWDCGEALCWQCPHHRGRGVGAQNKLCADLAIKSAYKHNVKVALVAKIPFKSGDLKQMPRTKLVQVLGLLGISAFKLKDSSKDGIVRWLTWKRQRELFKGIPTHLKATVAIPESLVHEKESDSA